jgi:sugar phosphate permease
MGISDMSETESKKVAQFPNASSWINWGLGVLYLMSCVFSVVSFAVLAPSIESESGLSKTSLSLLTSVFFFTYSFAQLVAGLLIDRVGSRWLLGVTTIIASVGGLLFIWTDNIVVMYLARALMAIGLSSAFVGGLYLAGKWFPASRFGLMSGITNMSANLAGAVGSWAIAGLPYKPVVLWWAVINVGIGVIILMFVKTRVPRIEKEQVDKEESLGLTEIFSFLFRSKQVWLASIFFAGTFGTFLSYADFWNIQVQQAYGHTIKDAALLNALLPIGLALGAVAFGWFSDAIGKIALPCRICAITSLVFLMTLIYTPSVPIWIVTILLFVSGFCIGGSTLAFPAAIQHCSTNIQGAAIGLVTTCGYISAGILNLVVPVIIGPVSGFQKGNFAFLSAARLNEVQLKTVFSFQLGMIPLAVALGLTAIATFMLRDVSRKNQPSDSEGS